jgi:hypothetical protein
MDVNEAQEARQLRDENTRLHKRPHSSLNYRTPAEFAAEASYAKVENAFRVSHFHTAAAAAG